MHWAELIKQAILGLVTLKNVVIYVAGVGSTMLYYRWKDKRDDVKDPDHAPHVTTFRRLWIYAAMGMVLFSFIAIRTQISADRSDTALNWTRQQAMDAKATSQHNKECFNHLADVMRQRGNLSDAIDPALQKQIDELGMWLQDLGTPPVDIANSDTTKQRYQDYAVKISQKYSELLAQERAEQAANAKIRAQNPVPDPGCVQ
jgi:hypothetical protein